MSTSWTWTFSLEDGNHVVGLNVAGATSWGTTGTITLDGFTIHTTKGVNALLNREFPFKIGNHVGVVKTISGFITGMKVELRVDGILLQSGTHTVVVEPRQTPVQPAASPTPTPPQSAPSSQGPVPFYPVLPPNCSNCHAPISMNTANWTGPMSASCPHCGAASKSNGRRSANDIVGSMKTGG